ncbi:MAG: PorV/PorQ family protein [Bacteroidota bacterium]
MLKFYTTSLLTFVATLLVFGGNPDRQGEAGATQLLLNPYAPSAGLHSLNTSSVSGVESMRINIAGLGRVKKSEVMLGYADYLSGSDLGLQAIGLASKLGESGTLGFSIMTVDFGDIPVTTDLQPEGTGANLNLSFLNIGIGYSHVFENKVSVGVLLRLVNESTSDVGAFGFAIDAGVQYFVGDYNEFKFGVSLRNIGSRMSYAGQGLSQAADSPDPRDPIQLTFERRAAGFEMPSVLDIGASYDILTDNRFATDGDDHRLTLYGNFTANSFSRDQVGGAIEYSFREQFTLRGGYRTDISDEEGIQPSLYSGLSAGATVAVPFSRENRDVGFSVSYAYRETNVYSGTHNFGLGFTF